MRELTKSLFSFSWAMSLFGVQQLANLSDPAKAAQAFDAVTGKAAEGFEGVAKTAFQTGEQVQRQMVELAFGLFARDALEPSRLLRTASDAMRQTAETLGQGVREASARVQSCQPADAAHAEGWGPMPKVNE